MRQTDDRVPWYWQVFAGVVVAPVTVTGMVLTDGLWPGVAAYVYGFFLCALICEGFRRPGGETQ